VPISDTKPEIAEMQIQLFRSMTGGQRVLMGMEMSLLSREFTKAGIRREHPDWSEREVILELLRLAFFPKPLPAWMR